MHQTLELTEAEATARVIKAIEKPFTDIIGHPTGRLLLQRPGFPLDVDKIFDACIANNVALEINANWMRLDLRDVHVRAALDAGCFIAINCDTHDPSDMDNLRFGVLTGRRGGLTPASCVNTWTATKLAKWLGRRRT